MAGKDGPKIVVVVAMKLLDKLYELAPGILQGGEISDN